MQSAGLMKYMGLDKKKTHSVRELLGAVAKGKKKR